MRAQIFEIRAASKPELALHRWLAVPVHLLDVDDLNCQPMTALGTPRLQYLTPVFRFHALTEAMHTQTAALPGLPCTLDHEILESSETFKKE